MFFGLAVTEETKLGAVITVAVALLWLWLGGGVEGLEPEAEVTTTTVFVCWIGSISLHRWATTTVFVLLEIKIMINLEVSLRDKFTDRISLNQM
jgi:hypothetical protein